MSQDIPVPSKGRMTFDAEGREGGPYHSRRFHVPTTSSGLTIGRGYDMKMRTRSEVRDDLIVAGVEAVTAQLISQAAGLKGEEAEAFIEENDLESFEISPDTQLHLFEIEYARQEKDARRLATKPDVTAAYGATDWDALNPIITQLLVDLRFRGDYTPSCRRFLQIHVAGNDLAGFRTEVVNRDRWPNVPRGRFDIRVAFCTGATGA